MPAQKSHLHPKHKVTQKERDAGGGVSEGNLGNTTPKPSSIPNQTDGNLSSPWNSPDQNTGVGSLSRLQGIFPTQGWNPGLLHCRQILYQLYPQYKIKSFPKKRKVPLM